MLIALYAFDHKGGGLHYVIARRLVAGNVWNGCFTLDSDGPRIELGDAEVLLGKSCYFHVPSSTANSYDYAIFPSFEQWKFPHNNLPPNWTCFAASARREGDVGLAPPSASNLTAAVIHRDGSCRVTNAQVVLCG